MIYYRLDYSMNKNDKAIVQMPIILLQTIFHFCVVLAATFGPEGALIRFVDQLKGSAKAPTKKTHPLPSIKKKHKIKAQKEC